MYFAVIGNFPEITLAELKLIDAKDIKKVWKHLIVFDALKEDQKALVTNLDVLTTAQQTYDNLKAAAEKLAASIGGVTSNCDATGASDNIDATEWSNLATQFDNLNASAQGYLGCITYNHNQETPNTIKDFIDRYDYIVHKYQDAKHFDFMQRGSLINELQPSNSLINKVETESSSIIVVVLITCVTVSVVGAYFFIRRKKAR